MKNLTRYLAILLVAAVTFVGVDSDWHKLTLFPEATSQSKRPSGGADCVGNCSMTSLTLTGPATALTINGVAAGFNAINLGTGTQRLKGGANANGWLQFNSTGVAFFGAGVQANSGNITASASG